MKVVEKLDLQSRFFSCFGTGSSEEAIDLARKGPKLKAFTLLVRCGTVIYGSVPKSMTFRRCECCDDTVVVEEFIYRDVSTFHCRVDSPTTDRNRIC